MDMAIRNPVKALFAMSTGTHLWQPISTAPHDRDLELAVINRDGTHALVFPCRSMPTGWVQTNTGERIEVSPTHWRDWINVST